MAPRSRPAATAPARPAARPAAPPILRCDEAIVQPVVRRYNAAGQVVGEQTLPQQKIFRALVPDLWASIDADLAAQIAAADPPDES